MLHHMAFKICIGTVFAVSWDFHFFMMFVAWFVANFTRQIQVNGRKELLINVVVQGTLGTANFPGM